MAKDVPNIATPAALASVGGAMAVYAAANAIGAGIAAEIWNARERSILKQNVKNIAEMQETVVVLREQTQTLLDRMIAKNETYPELTKENSIGIMLQHSYNLDQANKDLSYDGFALVKRLREIGLKMIEDIKELDLSAREEFLMELEEEAEAR